MNDKELVRVEVEGAPEDIGDMKIVDLIAALNAVLERTPAEFRDSAKIEIHAYDWDGVECSYMRPPTAEERAEAEALFADRAALIERTAPWQKAEWVRNIRLMTGVSRDEAVDMMRNDEGAVISHPQFDWKTKMVTG